MNYKAIIKTCREMGCCEACCVRYCALRKPTIFGDTRQFIADNTELETSETDVGYKQDGEGPPAKRSKAGEECEQDSGGAPANRSQAGDACVSCLGILQEDSWPECLALTKDLIDQKKYETSSFACALSAPLATLIREKAVLLRLSELFPSYDSDAVTPLKEAWKWSLGPRLAAHLALTLDSGACAPLMVTLNMDYVDDMQEADVFAPRVEPQRRRARAGRGPVTRGLLERELGGASSEGLRALLGWSGGPPRPRHAARCVSVEAAHAPLYLAGRYIKLSRELSQSPWVLRGQRMMESSVQEIIFQPIADLFGLSAESAEHRLKFLSAGREDVDVRCLGDGRPFAIEIADPRRALTPEELARACDRICSSRKVLVRALVPIPKDKLLELKKGEESKLKTYEALCIKLTHTAEDIAEGATPGRGVRVTARDLARVRGCWSVRQRTPLRVLHRRALLERTRSVTALGARAVPGHAALFAVSVRTEAGTYVKEWVHGELRRTRPALGEALGARADILALDVTDVQLAWP